MASYQNFEESLQRGIDVKDELERNDADYIRDREAIVREYTNAAEDNFYSLDNKTITESIELLSELNDIVKESNILYSEYEEYNTLMETILEDMEQLKQKKMAIDPKLINDDINLYNNTMEVARIAYSNHLLYKLCQNYNKSPIVTIKHYEDSHGDPQTVKTYEEVNGVIRSKSSLYNSSWTWKYDEKFTLNLTNIIDEYGNPVKKEERSSVININKTLQAKLKRVGKLDSSYKMPTKPDNL